jgi:hypothetical protein
MTATTAPVSTYVPQRLSANEAAIEARRHTRDLREKELKYLLRTVRIKQCLDADLHNQCVVDAILYYMNPVASVVPPALEDGGKRLTYYLNVKARNIYVDVIRDKYSKTHGDGLVKSLEAIQARADAEELSITAIRDQNPLGDEFDQHSFMLEKVRLALEKYPVKLRIFELHLEGFSLEEISDLYGKGGMGDDGRYDTNWARQTLFTARQLIQQQFEAPRTPTRRKVRAAAIPA